jgi:hypothetical protein
MKTLTRIDMVVMKDYDHMTIMDGNVNRMELTYLYNVSLSLNLRASY